MKPFETIEEEEELLMDYEDIIDTTPSNMADESRKESDDSDSYNSEESISDNENSVNDTKKELKLNNDEDFSNKKTPFELLEGLFKGLMIEYKHSTIIKNKITYYTCEVVVARETKGKGKFYNKKLAKYLAAINTLKQYGIDFDFSNILEDETTDDVDDLDDNSSQVSTKSVRFDQQVSIVKFNDYMDCEMIQMKPLNTADDDEQMSNALSISGSELDMIDDINQHSTRNYENRKRNLAFLWHDFDTENFKVRNYIPLRPLGSNMRENPIGFLNERCAKNNIPLPIYSMMSVPDGKKLIFQARISMCDLNFCAMGYSKKDAKFAAAKKLIVYALKLYKKNRRQQMYRRKFPNDE